MARHLQAAGRGMDQTGEHFEGGGLAGPVGSQKPDHFTGLDGKTHLAHRRQLLVAAAQKVAHGAGKTGLLIGHPVALAQAAGRHDRHLSSLTSHLGEAGAGE